MGIKLVIADDHPIVLSGLERLIERCSDIEIAATCPSGAETLSALREHHPDVLLLDLKLDGLGGLDVMREMNASGVKCRVVILTASATDEEIATAFELGVSGLVLKDSPPDAVVEAIRQVSLGRSWFDREVLGRALMSRRRERDRPAPQSTLTAREVELIRLVGDGLRNRDIAARLSISEGTVKIHLHNIYDKLGVDGRLELVLAAQHKGLI